MIVKLANGDKLIGSIDNAIRKEYGLEAVNESELPVNTETVAEVEKEVDPNQITFDTMERFRKRNRARNDYGVKVRYERDYE